MTKINNEMQTLLALRKVAVDELSARQQAEAKLRTEYDASRSLCSQFQAEAAQHADRCRTLEEAQAHILTDTNQIRSRLAVTSQLTKEQATQIVDLERRLMQSDDLSKTSNQRQALLEQQIRDLRLTSDKYQMAMQNQVEYSKQNAQREDQMNALETANNLLKEELTSVKADNECLTLMAKQEKDLVEDLRQQLGQLKEKHREENELTQKEMEILRAELNEKESDQQAYVVLKTSFTEIEKRCVKHQKTEIEVKRQLGVYQNFITDLQREIQDLTERLAAGADEYKNLFRKYTLLERSMEMKEPEAKVPPTNAPIVQDEEEELNSILRNNYENRAETKMSLARSSLGNIDGEERHCPMCFWEFPQNMNLDGKREHIENHFQ
jgi:chromosome segregation ATPase